MTVERPIERLLDHLLTLARAQRTEAPWRERQFLDRFDERLEARRAAKRRGEVRAVWAFAFAACSVVAVIGFFLLRPAPLSYSVAGGAVTGGYIESQGQAKARVDFSDGSLVALAPGARARVNDVTSDGGRVELERGLATVSVVKTGRAAWFVQAGPYTVHVTGTAFDVRWLKDEQRFELDLHHGSVVITGAPISGSIALSAGQRLVSLPSGPLGIQPARTKPVEEPTSSSTPTQAPETDAAADPVAATDPLPEPARESVAANAPPWSRLVAQGKFQQVIDAARARGLNNVLSSASLADLAALADAARYARKPDIARQALLSERRRFPGSRPARDAAFFLGTLEDGGARASLHWYERYLAESPSGPYTSQALGRRLMLIYRERGADAATPLARDYVERFPKGPYASAARKILDRLNP